jgi:hypothetical protein
MKLLRVQEVDVIHNLMKQWMLPDLAVLHAVFRNINCKSTEDDLLFCKPLKIWTTM